MNNSMSRKEFQAARRAGRIWYAGDWSRPVDPVAREVLEACQRSATPRDVYHEGYTAAYSLADLKAKAARGYPPAIERIVILRARFAKIKLESTKPYLSRNC